MTIHHGRWTRIFPATFPPMLEATDIVRTALFEALIIAAPILGAGVLVGLVISLLQALTQVQEQTLTFVPKIVVMALVIALLLAWIVERLVAFAGAMFTLG
jgi:flagellar biosynthetic protein FliQ